MSTTAGSPTRTGRPATRRVPEPGLVVVGLVGAFLVGSGGDERHQPTWTVHRPIWSGRPYGGSVARPFRQQIDEGILDRAAALFARHGFEHTSLQAVADAVGLSKAGLLHHFRSKDALHEAVLALADTLGERVLAQVRDLPVGAARDRRALEVLIDVALAHPGVVALLLAPVTQTDAETDLSEPGSPGAAALEAFGADPEVPEPERSVRVIGALTALAVLTLAAHARNTITTWRPLIVATCFDALGHHRPGAALSALDQVEA
jgi:AcrR family transcriptional regulator